MQNDSENARLRIAGITDDSIVDGPGIRLTVFVQGCPHNCEGCHNPQTHDFSAGVDMTVDEIMKRINANPLLDGVTFSGGEPFCQAEALSELSQMVHKKGLNVVTYSGYTYEYLRKNSDSENNFGKLLDVSDYLVDGPFIQAQKDMLLKFRGSRNQRIIDVKKSEENGSAVTAKI